MSTPEAPVRRAGRVFLVAALVAGGYAAGVLTGVVGSQPPASSATAASGSVLDEAEARIMAQAARPVTQKQLDQAAVEGMLKALGDRWSAYYSEAGYSSFSAGLDGRYSGIGVWLRAAQDGHVYVSSVQKASPAEKAGLLAGDRVLAVDQRTAAAATLGSTASALRGAQGTKVRLRISRDGEARNVTVVRGAVASSDVDVTRLKGNVDVVRVAAFTRGVGIAVRKAVETQPGEAPLAGVVLDLRGDPGGLLTEAVEVASAFLDGGPVVSYQRRGEAVQHLDALGHGNAGVPLVVLVDDGTASAAEVVAGALQDRNRAVLVGTRTFGKGSIQEPTHLPDGSVIELTVGTYLTPSGRSLDGVGLEPDVLVSSRAGSATAEQRALEVIRGLVAASDSSQRG